MDEPVTARRNAGCSRRQRRPPGDSFKSRMAGRFSRPDPDPFRYRKEVFNAATAAAFWHFSVFPPKAILPRACALQLWCGGGSMFDLGHYDGGLQSLAKRPAQAAASATLDQFSNSKLKDALPFANPARCAGANALHFQPSCAKARSEELVYRRRYADWVRSNPRRIRSCLADLDRDLPPDLDDLIGGKAEEVADVSGVALHDGVDPLLPDGHAHAILTGNHGLAAHIIGHVVEVDRATKRLAGGEQFRNMRAFNTP